MEAGSNTSPRTSVSPSEPPSLPSGTMTASDSKDRVSWMSSGTITRQDQDEAYEKAAKIVEAFSDGMIDKWNKEIDNLLVFAALYSGVLTSFNVQSYPYLQPAAPDATLAVLQQISLQLISFTSTPPFTNSTHVAPILAAVQTPSAPLWVVILNILWFWALIISLGVAYFALMCQQWLREYQDRCSGTSREYARLRQYRLNNLTAWRVSWIIGILPVLLQVSLSLFFAGLLILLWNFHSTVAIFSSALVGAVMFTILMLTILPILRSHCPFLTPPGDTLLYALQWSEFVFKHVAIRLGGPVIWVVTVLSRCDLITPGLSGRLINRWLQWTRHIVDAHLHIFTTRHGQELATAHNSSSKLDVDMIVDGYHTTMTLDHVSNLVPILIHQAPDEVDRCLTRIHEISRRHHSRSERMRDISVELQKPFEPAHRWSSYLGEGFRELNGQQRRTVLFMLSAAVMARGDGTTSALNDLADIFDNNGDACQAMEWDSLEYVARAVVKLTERYLAGEAIKDMTLDSFDRAFGLFRWVWTHRKDARDHQAFFPLALRMGYHLHQSLAKPGGSRVPTESVLGYLSETLDVFLHDAHGLRLAGGLLADIKRTDRHMRANLDRKLEAADLRELMPKVKTLEDAIERHLKGPAEWTVFSGLHLQASHAIGVLTGRGEGVHGTLRGAKYNCPA